MTTTSSKTPSAADSSATKKNLRRKHSLLACRAWTLSDCREPHAMQHRLHNQKHHMAISEQRKMLVQQVQCIFTMVKGLHLHNSGAPTSFTSHSLSHSHTSGCLLPCKVLSIHIESNLGSVSCLGMEGFFWHCVSVKIVESVVP